MGVDVFFVISGYLITGHLLREVASTGRVDLPGFYARRARRLLPAASLTLVTVGVAAYLWMPPSTWPTTAADMAASAVYAENWVLVRRSVDYLAQDEPPSPLQHFWSLAEEEQFYLGWPLLIGGIAVVWRRRSGGGEGKAGCDGLPSTAHDAGTPLTPSLRSPPRPAFALPMALACGLSFVTGLWYARTDPAAGYFMTHVRLFELGAGGLAAGMVRAGPPKAVAPDAHGPLPTCLASFTSRTLTVVAGLAAIGASGCLYTAGTPFPGLAALAPVLGTVAVIVAGEGGGPDAAAAGPAVHALARSLAHPWLQYFGDVSYSLYLAHWPVVIFYPSVTGRAVDAALLDGVKVLVVAWVLAHACHRWVENLFRARKPSKIQCSKAVPSITGVLSRTQEPGELSKAGMLTLLAVAAVTTGVLFGSACLSRAARFHDVVGGGHFEEPRHAVNGSSTMTKFVPSSGLHPGAEAWVLDASQERPATVPASDFIPPIDRAHADYGPGTTLDGNERCIARIRTKDLQFCTSNGSDAASFRSTRVTARARRPWMSARKA